MTKSNQKSLALHMEEKSPFVLAAIAFILLFFMSDKVTLMFKAGDWKSSGLYSAIFDWSAIQTGFAFSVYGFVVGKSSDFIARVERTLAMSRFKSYIKKSKYKWLLAHHCIYTTDYYRTKITYTWHIRIHYRFCVVFLVCLVFFELPENGV